MIVGHEYHLIDVGEVHDLFRAGCWLHNKLVRTILVVDVERELDSVLFYDLACDVFPLIEGFVGHILLCHPMAPRFDAVAFASIN